MMVANDVSQEPSVSRIEKADSLLFTTPRKLLEASNFFFRKNIVSFSSPEQFCVFRRENHACS